MGAARYLVQRELRGAVRGYWFLAYSGVLILGGLVLVSIGGASGDILGHRGYARALAGLAHLGLVVVPLMALFPAATALAGDRESGALDYLLAQPITRSQLYTGKWLGVTTAVLASLALAYGLFGSVAVLRGVGPELVLALFGATVLLAVAFVSLGLLISAVSTSAHRAISIAVAAWLFLLALGSLGVMGAFVRWQLPRGALVVWSFLNPIEACRLAIVPLLDPDVGLLGPVSADLVARIGTPGLVALAAASLMAWSLVAALAGRRLFRSAGS
ncbi:MAG: ABC transporter permease [Gemmatimonadota bacterium]